MTHSVSLIIFCMHIAYCTDAIHRYILSYIVLKVWNTLLEYNLHMYKAAGGSKERETRIMDILTGNHVWLERSHKGFCFEEQEYMYSVLCNLITRIELLLIVIPIPIPLQELVQAYMH